VLYDCFSRAQSVFSRIFSLCTAVSRKRKTRESKSPSVAVTKPYLWSSFNVSTNDYTEEKAKGKGKKEKKGQKQRESSWTEQPPMTNPSGFGGSGVKDRQTTPMRRDPKHNRVDESEQKASADAKECDRLSGLRRTLQTRPYSSEIHTGRRVGGVDGDEEEILMAQVVEKPLPDDVVVLARPLPSHDLIRVHQENLRVSSTSETSPSPSSSAVAVAVPLRRTGRHRSMPAVHLGLKGVHALSSTNTSTSFSGGSLPPTSAVTKATVQPMSRRSHSKPSDIDHLSSSRGSGVAAVPPSEPPLPELWSAASTRWLISQGLLPDQFSTSIAQRRTQWEDKRQIKGKKWRSTEQNREGRQIQSSGDRQIDKRDKSPKTHRKSKARAPKVSTRSVDLPMAVQISLNMNGVAPSSLSSSSLRSSEDVSSLSTYFLSLSLLSHVLAYRATTVHFIERLGPSRSRCLLRVLVDAARTLHNLRRALALFFYFSSLALLFLLSRCSDQTEPE